MAESIVTTVQEKLKQDSWTRVTISNYSKTQFQELAEYVQRICNENCIDEVSEICKEQLAHNKNSIIGLYIYGMLNLKKKQLDNSALVALINIFQENHKNQIVTFICEGILAEDNANKYALRTLAECYKEDNDPRLWEIYETIVRLDHEEADIAKIIAENAEKEGNDEKAIEFYKKALLRYVSHKAVNKIKEIWTKLVNTIPEEIDFFYLVQRKIAKTISEDRSALLMQELYVYYKDNAKWDIAIDILKLVLKIDEKDTWARKEIVECFRSKYEGHSQLEEYIRISNLSQGWRNVFEAISDFEKHIAFDAKNFVFHRTWGVGIIKAVQSDELVINFGKRHGIHNMSLKMAVSSLQPLDSDHIWVLKATKPKPELVELVKSNQVDALKIIIRSFDNNCDFKRIKAELVPAILTASEWTSWSTKARRILDNDPTFGVNPTDISMYTVKDRAISTEEKLANEFKAQKNFFSRIDILMKFANDDNADTESEYFTEMFNYFTSYLKSINNVNEQVVASFLIYRTIVAQFPHMAFDTTITFAQLFAEIENPCEMYSLLKDTKNTSLRKDYLSNIKNLLPNWSDIYINLFPTVLQHEMLNELIDNGYTEKVKQLAVNSFENYRLYREAAIFFFKECANEEWFKEINISYEKQLISLIRIMEINYKEIANHKDTTENRKINRQIQLLLFKDDTLLSYMMKNDIDTITRLYTLVDDIKDLDTDIKSRMRYTILKQYPDFKFFGGEEKVSAPTGLIVTAKMMEVKKRELDHIISVELPNVAKEIAEAREFGDLSENAEYSAAKEHQRNLNNTAGKLQEEIAKAQIFDPTTVNTTRVSFGTVTTMMNLQTNKEETYTILGPWESDPTNGIYSYKTQVAIAILNAKEGEELSFTINNIDRHLKVLSIKPYNFD